MLMLAFTKCAPANILLRVVDACCMATACCDGGMISRSLITVGGFGADVRGRGAGAVVRGAGSDVRGSVIVCFEGGRAFVLSFLVAGWS